MSKTQPKIKVGTISRVFYRKRNKALRGNEMMTDNDCSLHRSYSGSFSSNMFVFLIHFGLSSLSGRPDERNILGIFSP